MRAKRRRERALLKRERMYLDTLKRERMYLDTLKRDPKFQWELMSNIDVETLRLAVKVQDALIADGRI